MRDTPIRACPKCGSKVLVKGCSFKLSTPKIIRKIRRMHGITCVFCGYSQPTVKRWNNAERKMQENEK